jgi:hypothetical protein
MSGTASGITHFVLGSEDDGNREVLNVEDGEEYFVDASTSAAYSSGTTRFPYLAD